MAEATVVTSEMAEGAAPSDGHGFFPSNLEQGNDAQAIQPREALPDAHGREEHIPAVGLPPSSSTKDRGKAIQAYEEEHDGAAPSTKFVPKANADNMKHINVDDSLKSAPLPKRNEPPEILSHPNDARDHSPSRDKGCEHDPRASNWGLDDSTHTGESSTTKSTGVVRDGTTSLCAAELAKGTAAASSSMKSVIPDGITSPCAAELAKGTAAAPSSIKSVIPNGPSTENVKSPLGGPSSLMLSPTKVVQNAPGSEEHILAVPRPPSPSTKSRGKAIEAYDKGHDGAASSTKILRKAIADAGPSVQAPAQHHDGAVAVIGGPADPNASDVASNVAPAIPGFALHDINVAIVAIGGGGAAAAAQPNVARHVPAPAQINGGGNAVIAARPAPAQLNAGGPAPNAAPPVPVLPPNPGLNNIDEALTNSGIRPLRNPADGDEGKLWDKLN